MSDPSLSFQFLYSFEWIFLFFQFYPFKLFFLSPFCPQLFSFLLNFRTSPANSLFNLSTLISPSEPPPLLVISTVPPIFTDYIFFFISSFSCLLFANSLIQIPLNPSFFLFPNSRLFIGHRNPKTYPTEKIPGLICFTFFPPNV